RTDRPWSGEPLWLDCPAAYVYDNLDHRWWIVGEPDARAALPPPDTAETAATDPSDCTLGEPTGLHDPDRARYQRAVARTVEYIRAGDIFQANLTHRLSAPFRGDSRALFLELVRRTSPWYGAYLEIPDTD